MARIANLNATTLKKIRSFPAEYAHLLHSGAYNLDEFSLDGRLPEGTVTNLPRTGTFNESYCPVVPTHAHLLNAKKLCFPHGLHEFKPDEVQKSSPHVEEIVIHENCLWSGTNWTVLMKQLRHMFPNWRHLGIDMEVDVDDVGYDEYFKETAEEWSDAFEEHLRQDTAPLRIDATMPMYLENEGRFRASDLPKFKLDVRKKREGWGTETTFTFTRNEDFGEGRILCMEAKVERLVRDGEEWSASEEEDDEKEEEESVQDD
ncbi:hypothetical protein AAVH_39907 [Aphelenchoides avenae]|nr:hypothetical protein AAVH_39907 [Aphelenchus avenae]